MARALATALGVEWVDPDDDFFALGGDSIVSLQAAAAARRTGLSLTPAAILTLRNPRAIAAAIDSAGVDERSSSLVTLDSGPGSPVVLIGGAGGGPEAMLSVARGLAGRTVRAFKAGADRRTIDSLAEGLVEALPPADLDRGVVLVGHSFGAYVALEAIRRLRSRGHSAWLIVLDATAPLPDRPRSPPDGDATLYAGLAAMAAEVMGRGIAGAADRAAVLSLLIEAAIAADAAAAEALIAESRDHGEENARYVAAPIALPSMLLVRAVERAEPPRPFEPPPARDPDWGWSRLTGGHVATAMASGNHISMLRGEAGVALGAMLRAYIDFEIAADATVTEERIYAR